MMTVGMPAAFASSTGRTSARSSSGARTIPFMPWLRNPSTTCTCCSRSSSRSGPFQVRVTFTPLASNSCAAFTAPAWMAFQNSCVVPLGTTPIEYEVDEAGFCEHAGAVRPAARTHDGGGAGDTGRTRRDVHGALLENAARAGRVAEQSYPSRQAARPGLPRRAAVVA